MSRQRMYLQRKGMQRRQQAQQPSYTSTPESNHRREPAPAHRSAPLIQRVMPQRMHVSTSAHQLRSTAQLLLGNVFFLIIVGIFVYTTLCLCLYLS